MNLHQHEYLKTHQLTKAAAVAAEPAKAGGDNAKNNTTVKAIKKM